MCSLFLSTQAGSSRAASPHASALSLSLSLALSLSLSLSRSLTCQPRRKTQPFRLVRVSTMKCENWDYRNYKDFTCIAHSSETSSMPSVLSKRGNLPLQWQHGLAVTNKQTDDIGISAFGHVKPRASLESALVCSVRRQHVTTRSHTTSSA